MNNIDIKEFIKENDEYLQIPNELRLINNYHYYDNFLRYSTDIAQFLNSDKK